MDSRSPVFQLLKPRNLVALLAGLCTVLAVATHNPLMVMLSAASLATILVSGLRVWGLLENVRVERDHHPRVFQGNSVAVSLRISGSERRTPELLLVEDSFPPSTTSRIRRLVEHPIGREFGVQFQYFGLCEHRRGLYILGPVRLQAADELGFFQRELFMEDFSELVIYPQAVDLHQLDLLGAGTLAHVGLETTRRTGASEEFLGVREYRPGDPISLVHWRSTAHHDRLMVKEFQEEMTTVVTFFLDVGRLGLVGVGDQTSVEYGIKCCASMAKRAVERGHQVGLFAVGATVEHLPPGGGTAHLLALLDRLAFVKPMGDSGFAAVVRDLAKGLPRGSTAVLVMGATTIDFDALAPGIALLIDRRILPVVVAIDDRAFIKIFQEQEERHYRALPLEDIVNLLRLMGARVHVVRRAKSMGEALVAGLEQEAVS